VLVLVLVLVFMFVCGSGVVVAVAVAVEVVVVTVVVACGCGWSSAHTPQSRPGRLPEPARAPPQCIHLHSRAWRMRGACGRHWLAPSEHPQSSSLQPAIQPLLHLPSPRLLYS
jgi:hypothetical protein